MTFEKSVEIDQDLRTCIVDMICNAEYGEWENDECRFTLYRVQAECSGYNKSLVDSKIARRHLDYLASTGMLGVDYSMGKTEYIYQRHSV
jgi:hypothetical protein